VSPDLSHGGPRVAERYELGEILGSGSMGVVYRARDRESDTEVALKTLARPSPQDLLLLKREFRFLADMLHPNLVRLYDLEVQEDRAYFTMELIVGERLLDALGPPGASDPDRIRDVFGQLALGLTALHEKDLLHRDVKPANVLLERGGRVVLLDFGLVVGGEHELSLASRGELAGTLAYMAPEQAWGHQLAESADWYAVGVMLYEVLSGRLPFAGPSLASLLDRQHREPEPPDGPASLADPALAALALDLLAYEPGARPTGVEIRARLSHRSPVVAPRPTPTRRPVFVDRDAERAELLRAFEHTRRGRSMVVQIDGPAGIGKSSLVDHVLLGLERDRDALVLRSRCHPQAKVRFAALDGCVDELSRFLVQLGDGEREALRPSGVPALCRMFPVLARVPFARLEAEPDPGDADPALTRRIGFAALRELLERTATRHPLVLWMDDLQWGDADSALFLDELARAENAPPLLLIRSYRTEDREDRSSLAGPVASDAPANAHFELGPLEIPDLEALIEARLAEAPHDGDRVTALAVQAAGSPLFATQLAAFAHRSESSDAVQLRDVLLARLRELSPSTLDLLGWVAVSGRPIGTQVVLALSPDGRRGMPGIYELCRSGWLRPIPADDEVDVLHGRFRDVMLGHLGDTDVRRRHRDIGIALVATRSPDPSTVYEHFRAAGDPAASEWVVRAAEDAASRLAFDRAAELYGEAFELRGRAAADWPLLEQRASALAAAGRSALAAGVFATAAAAADRVSDEPLDGVMLRGRSAEQHLYAGELEPGTALLREVLSQLGVEQARTARASQLRALAGRARFLLTDLVGGVERARRRARQPDPRALRRLDVLHGASRGLYMLDSSVADAIAARQLLDTIHVGEPSRLVRVLGLEAAFEANVGGAWLRRHAMGLLDRVDALARETGQPFDRAWALISRSNVAWFNGAWRECVERGREAVEWMLAHCVGIQWERTSNDLFTLSALAQMGELAELRKRIPAMIGDARQRGDAYAVMACRTGDAAFVALADDDVERAQAEIAEAGRPYAGGDFTSVDYYHLYPWIQLQIYRGADAAHTDLERAWPALERAGFHRLDCIGNGMRHLRGRAALAAAMRATGERREALVRLADTAARRMARSSLPQSPGLAAALRAGVAALRGDTDARVAALEQSLRVLDAAEMALYAGAARRQLGRLVGGDRGRALLAEADARFAREGVRRPDAFEVLLLPGDPALA